ncbi:Trk system potassium transporter TrkA [Saprospira sp. CCB-QB6]|uniref:Trk system potassium transporter TrkA n=1 Tax=Saprospira sp. CCB-QB6 TaxID=3023936 RepID=UPI00234B015D|nr:Trk system potassium transporter TrkA [Saprospira sp. CCB-QB6]WCL81622.1 Trk system potassium transporter TrkA [Saprospira sp. CCB-QB6]
MKIIIAGAGEVGFHLARLLADEQQDITLIDTNKDRLAYIENRLDVLTLNANAASTKALRQAKIERTDMLIAATASETTNITIGLIGKKLGARHSIVRVSNSEYLSCGEGDFSLLDLGIDELISPAALVTHEIERLLEQSGVTDSIDFGDGQLKVVGVHLVEEDAPILNKSVVEAAAAHGKKLMPVAIRRGYKTLIPRGNSVFKQNDFAYFVSCAKDLPDLMKFTGKPEVNIRNIMIVGGSLIGQQSAKLLSHKYNVKLVELNRDKCYNFAERLPETLVIHGDARQVDLLKEENIDEMDAFIAVTGNSETNIMSCLVAKSLGVRQTIALVENMDYIHLSQNIGIDTLINKKLLAASNIFKFVRKGEVLTIGNLHGVQAEILEFEVKAKSKITRFPIRKLGFPEGAIIGGVLRGSQSYTPLGDFKIEEGDRVVVFTLPDAIRKVERFFK